MAVNGASHLDQAPSAKELHRLRPDQVRPAALFLALQQGGGEFLVHGLPPPVPACPSRGSAGKTSPRAGSHRRAADLDIGAPGQDLTWVLAVIEGNHREPRR